MMTPEELQAETDRYAALPPGHCRTCDCVKAVPAKERGMSGATMCTCHHATAAHRPIPHVPYKPKVNGMERPF